MPLTAQPTKSSFSTNSSCIRLDCREFFKHPTMCWQGLRLNRH
jgi:hypothetical protein